jgi:hypothetical protein
LFRDSHYKNQRQQDSGESSKSAQGLEEDITRGESRLSIAYQLEPWVLEDGHTWIIPSSWQINANDERDSIGNDAVVAKLATLSSPSMSSAIGD